MNQTLQVARFYLVLILFLLLLFNVVFLKSETFTRLELSDWSTNFFLYLYIKHVTRKFIVIRISKVFSLDFGYFSITIFFLTKPLRQVILSSFSLSFVLRPVIVVNPLIHGIFIATYPFFFSKFCFSMFYWLIRIKVVPLVFFLSVLSNFVFSVFLTTWLYCTYHFVFSSLYEQFLTHQHLHHLLLLLNYWK